MIRVLLRLYPRAWRRRYSVEFEAQLEDSGVGPRESLDLPDSKGIRRAAGAWFRGFDRASG